MTWAVRNQNGSGLLVWCLAALITLAQFQNSIHFHDQNDVNTTHECTVCAVAAHLDDIDSAEQKISEERQFQISLAPEFALHPPGLVLIHVKTRAPPVS